MDRLAAYHRALCGQSWILSTGWAYAIQTIHSNPLRMSRFIVNQIAGRLESLFKPHLDLSDLNQSKDASFNDKVVTRALAAFAVHAVGSVPVEEAAMAVVDGGDDNGIDAIYFNQVKKRLLLVQSKYIKDGSSEPSAGELRSFRDGVNDFLDGKLDRFNAKLQTQTDAIAAVTQFGVRCDVIVIHTGSDTLAKHGSTVLRELMDNLNGSQAGESQDKFATLHVLSFKDVFDLLAKDQSDSAVDLTFHLKEWGKTDQPYLAYYGRVYGEKVGEWWAEFGDRLLQDNIRGILGETEVNEQIAYTATDQPELFWYFNNGITILAESVQKSAENRDNRDFGYFQASRASVVNGAQTVSVLGRLHDQGVDLSKLEIPLRIIELRAGSEDIRKDITRTNNTQNTILSKDFIAQDPVQESLQKQASLLGWTYQVKRDASWSEGANKFDLDEAIEALVMLSAQPSYAATFRKELGRFYIMDRSPYKALFNASLSGYKLVNAINFRRLVHQASEQLRDQLPPEERVSRKAQVLSNGIVLIAQIVVARLGAPSDLSSAVIAWDGGAVSSTLASAADDVFEYCDRVYQGMYLRPLFQNSTKCDAIYRDCT